MPDTFSEIVVPDDASDASEHMGSKDKFWYFDEVHGRCLFKIPRPATGEDWAEKAAAELAALIGLPHAHVELAVWRGTYGTFCESILEGLTPLLGLLEPVQTLGVSEPTFGVLVHGNELLSIVHPDYPPRSSGTPRFFRVPQHTVERVMEVLARPQVEPPLSWPQPDPLLTAAEIFVGYLMLDAWIGNTDRHHENWGIIWTNKRRFHLSPTFDHASSLGRELTDESRLERLRSNDAGRSVAAYADRARSAFFDSPTDHRPLLTLDAFRKAAQRFPAAAQFWIERLARLDESAAMMVWDCFPDHRITPLAREFGQQVLRRNRDRILGLADVL